MQTDSDHMLRALALAKAAADAGEVPVGCVVVTADGTVVGEGANARESSFDPTAHAEVIAIRQAASHLGRWRLSDCTLFVTLEPCFMCAGAIINARVKRVVYGASDPKAGACESLGAVLQDARLNHRCEVVTGVEKENSSQLLREFFKSRRQ